MRPPTGSFNEHQRLGRANNRRVEIVINQQ
jgi:outer membrane protein OmpA-like peptidoglycan-associated protein